MITKEAIEAALSAWSRPNDRREPHEIMAEALTTAFAAMPGPAVKVKPLGWEPPEDCDGMEQIAFEEWAASNGYDMHEHPLHYLFIDKKTYSARQGWKAALKYVRDQFAVITKGPKP